METCSTEALPEADEEDECAMGEMLRTISSLHDEFDEGMQPLESFEDLFDEAADEQINLFERVGSDEAAPSMDDEAIAIDDEGIRLFDEEVEVLQSMYDYCKWNDRHDCLSVQILNGDALHFAIVKRGKKSSGVILNILRLRGYPQRPPEVCIEPWHNILTPEEVHHLYAQLKEQLTTMAGAPQLMGICAEAGEVCDSMIKLGTYSKATVSTIEEASELRELGVKIRTKDEKLSPSLYVGGIADLIAKVPKCYDVINVENVLRPDLAMRFEKMQRYFYQKYVARVENRKDLKHLRLQQHVLKLADIRPAFHGTRMVNVGKIVRSGLLVPGEQSGVRVLSGSRYGQGIYSSPDPNLALCYAGSGYEDVKSIKLMVVAVLMGKEKKIMDGEEPWGGKCTEGFDSHISEDGSQFVVFNEAQILPCYVLHLMQRTNTQPGLDLGTTNTYEVEKMAHHATEKRKVILTQMAKKNLPFGFGPRGANFVVEEIADYSDDDEDWGQFQELRHGGGVGHEEYQHETLLPPPPPPEPPKVKKSHHISNPNR